MSRVFLRIACILCILPPALALDRDAFTFARYDLRVQIEPEQQRMGVRGTIILRNDSNAPQKNLSLQISSSLAWRSITVGGKPVQFVSQPYTSDVDHTGALSEAIVTLPQPIPAKGTVQLEIGYEGVIPLDVTRLTRMGIPETQAKLTDWDQIGDSFSAVRGVGYVTWYPVSMDAASLSDGDSVSETVGRWKRREAETEMRLSFTLSNDQKLIASGKEFSSSSAAGANAADEPSTSFEIKPLGFESPSFAIGKYDTLQGTSALAVYFLSEDRGVAQTWATASSTVLPFVTRWFGTPQTKVVVVDLQIGNASPFESGTLLLTPLRSSDLKLTELNLAHQLTHASFASERPWIFEGLAHFAQALYREQQDGRQAALDLMGAQLPAIIETEKSLPAAREATAQSLVNTSLEELYRSKAMYVWWMLRDMVGEQPLKNALAAYRSDQDHEPGYMQRLIAAQTHRDLEWFFDDWVYRDRGLPDFRVDSVYPRKTMQGNYMVTVTVENLGSAGAEVPVIVRVEGGEESKRIEVHGKSKNSIRIEVPSPPQEVVVNDGSVPESDMTNNTFKVPPSQTSEQP